MPDFLISGLRAHRARQLQEKLIAGPGWRDSGLVFTTSNGTPIDARNLVRDFHKILEKAGLRHIRFHDLRHSCATLLLAQNVHPKIVMEILRHSQISLTLDTYSHMLPQLQEEAVQKMSAILRRS